jgi:Autotransporter beta-domain
LSGAATLTGGTVQVPTPAQNFAPQTSYTILTAGTRNSITFAGVTASSIFLAPSLSYPSQQQVVLTLNALPFNTAAQTPNQIAVANALNAGSQNALTAQLFGQTSIAGARQAFNALSGEVYGSVQNTQADQTQFTRNAILGRLRQSDSSGDTAALASGGPELGYAETVDSSSFGGGAIKSIANGWHDLTTWVQGFGGVGHVDADANGNAAALRSNFSGFLTGTDVGFGTMRVRLVGGYTATNLDLDGRSSTAGISSALLGTYAGTNFGALRLRSGAVASFDSIDTSRLITFPGFADSAKACLNGYTGQAFGEVGLRHVVRPDCDRAFRRPGPCARPRRSVHRERRYRGPCWVGQQRKHRLFLARRARRDAGGRRRAEPARLGDTAARLRRRHLHRGTGVPEWRRLLGRRRADRRRLRAGRRRRRLAHHGADEARRRLSRRTRPARPGPNRQSQIHLEFLLTSPPRYCHRRSM